MNNINCEHCGALIDVTKDKKCTNCGAPYKNNKQYKEYQEYQKRQKELSLESQKLANDITRDVHNTTKKMVPGVFITIIIIFIVSLSVFFFIFYNIVKQTEKRDTTNNNYHMNDYDDKIDLNDFFDTKQDKEIVSLLFNETAYTDNFNITVNKVSKYTEKHFAKNQELYGFNVVFKNKTESWKNLDSIKLVYTDNEGDEQELSKATVSTSTLDFFASSKKTYEGFIYFEVPDYVKNVTLVYDNIHITINNFRNYIK